VASREEQKRKAREEREAKERREEERSAKRKRLLRIGIGAAVVVVAAIIAVVALSGGSKKTNPGLAAGNAQSTPGPWNSGSDGLEKRAAALGLPDPSDTVFHIHAQLTVYTDGKKQKVPQNIGIDEGSQFLTSLHTHDDTGVIHMESVQPFPFKLTQFFQVWNVPFTTSQLGAYRVGKGLVLQTWVNGKQVKDGPNYVMKPHDRIVVGFGKPGSFPTKSNFKFPPGE
jgi:hypothetical protein